MFPLNINLSNLALSLIIFARIASLYLRCKATLLILPSAFVRFALSFFVKVSMKFVLFTPAVIFCPSLSAVLACVLAFGSPFATLFLSVMSFSSFMRCRRFSSVFVCKLRAVSLCVSASIPSFSALILVISSLRAFNCSVLSASSISDVTFESCFSNLSIFRLTLVSSSVFPSTPSFLAFLRSNSVLRAFAFSFLSFNCLLSSTSSFMSGVLSLSIFPSCSMSARSSIS